MVGYWKIKKKAKEKTNKPIHLCSYHLEIVTVNILVYFLLLFVLSCWSGRLDLCICVHICIICMHACVYVYVSISIIYNPSSIIYDTHIYIYPTYKHIYTHIYVWYSASVLFNFILWAFHWPIKSLENPFGAWNKSLVLSLCRHCSSSQTAREAHSLGAGRLAGCAPRALLSRFCPPPAVSFADQMGAAAKASVFSVSVSGQSGPRSHKCLDWKKKILKSQTEEDVFCAQELKGLENGRTILSLSGVGLLWSSTNLPFLPIEFDMVLFTFPWPSLGQQGFSPA